MIISDRYQFVFVHIPKCAGTTLRNALAQFDEAAARYHDKAVAEHPVLGPLDYAHIPLLALKEHFPDDYARFDGYDSFALLRDPYHRFPSSLHERFVQRDRKPLKERERSEIAREVDEVLATLARLPRNAPVLDPGLIHFSRQSDYVFCEGRQVVRTLRTVAQVDDLLNEISAIVGKSIRPEESKNRRLAYAFPVVERIQKAITRPIEKALPRNVWKPVFKPIKAAFLATGLIRHAGNPLAELPNADVIDAFIAEFYAEDIRLFEQVNGGCRGNTLQTRVTG